MDECDLYGKGFNVSISSDEYFQATYVNFYLTEDCPQFRVPDWNYEDTRWEEAGVVILKYTAKIMTKKEYDNLDIHYEDDWYDWMDVLDELNEKDENDESDEND